MDNLNFCNCILTKVKASPSDQEWQFQLGSVLTSELALGIVLLQNLLIIGFYSKY
jgi:hypothetical protein